MIGLFGFSYFIFSSFGIINSCMSFFIKVSIGIGLYLFIPFKIKFFNSYISLFIDKFNLLTSLYLLFM